jgi:hypothetical protein
MQRLLALLPLLPPMQVMLSHAGNLYFVGLLSKRQDAKPPSTRQEYMRIACQALELRTLKSNNKTLGAFLAALHLGV